MDTKKAHSVHVHKDFPVSVNALYNAWISPEALKQWCAPIGNRLKEVKNEVKEGGTIDIEQKAKMESTHYLFKGKNKG